ncbi:Proteoglycan 4 C-terminal part like [Melia azedarach]|uniref:Proteoglycan 4 C-terminal part like n=1 Tax=Melia azedarach TaxID=155640 RepID=A0ACC1X4V8_MELAZ|nr:Proteoglycan 4 C-terminal part like [Melia azedarach]
MARVTRSKTIMMLFVLAAFAMAATVSAQSTQMAPAPSPSMDTGAAFSLPVSAAAVGSSLFVSLLALLKH